MARAFSLTLDVPTVAPNTGTAVSCYYLKDKVVQVHTLGSGEYQVEISTDGIHYQDYGDLFTATGFLHIPFFVRTLRVRCATNGSAAMLLSGTRES